MKKYFLIILLVFVCCLNAQTTSRVLLTGQLKCDDTAIQNVVIFNINLRSGTVVKNDGDFEIKAKVKDTLVFSSINFFTKKIVLTEEDFIQKPFVVSLKIKINTLDEVIVANDNKKYNPIGINTQKYVDLQFVADEKSHLKNENVYDGQTPGINFVRLITDVFKLFKSKNPKKIDFFEKTDFTELVLNKVKYSYFVNNLKLKDEEIRLFLVFCENDDRAKDASRYKTVFELMDFLYNKNLEFTAIKNKP